MAAVQGPQLRSSVSGSILLRQGGCRVGWGCYSLVPFGSEHGSLLFDCIGYIFFQMCLDLTDSHSDLFDKIQWQLEMHGRQVVNEHYKLQNHAQIPQLGSQEVASQSSKESSQPLHG